MPVALLADQSLGQLWWSDDGLPGIDLLPSTVQVLADLALRGAPAWILADLDDNGCDILGRWLPGVAGVVPLHGEMAEALTTIGDECGVIVAADRDVRAAGSAAGWQAVPAPAMAAWVLDGHEPCLARIAGGDDVVARLRHLVVLRRDPDGVLAFTTPASLAMAAVGGATVHRYPTDLRQDPVVVRTAGATFTPAVAALGRRKVLAAWGPSSSPEVLVSLDAGDDLNDRALHAAHGHYQLLTPIPGGTVPRRGSIPVEADLLRWRWPWPERINELPIVIDWPKIRWPRCWGWSVAFAHDVARYSGGAPLDAAGPIASRHVRHPDNDRAVDALLADLRAIGYCPWVHTFSYGGRTVRNVLADLPACGWWARPEILERIRARLLHPTVLRSPERLLDGLDDLLSEFVATVGGPPDELVAGQLTPTALRNELRAAAVLHPWLPWWRLRCLLGGIGAGIVVVGCHLDSTASRDAGYDPMADPAPGADDDASGIAGTLAAARWLWPLRGTMRNTVRFAFFNAEEAGLVGSGAYVAHLAAFGAPIVAAVCMDMIGHESDTNRIFEVHCGATDATVRDASDPIATRIASWTTCLGSLPMPQIYRGTSSSGGTDRNLYDGAIGRSDHASFHAHGYPAAVVSEDFFANLPTEPASDANPTYHRHTDAAVDASYGAEIACAVAHAVRDIATNGL
jgi:hypothetical protein